MSSKSGQESLSKLALDGGEEMSFLLTCCDQFFGTYCPTDTPTR
jgi:hypothetical protein